MLISRKVTQLFEISHVKFEGRMERVDKTDKSFRFFFGAGCGSKTVIYVAAKKFRLETVRRTDWKFVLLHGQQINWPSLFPFWLPWLHR